MNYYFSGIGESKRTFIRYATKLASHRLLSCHDSYAQFAHTWLRETISVGHGKKQTILLDSGAFTAWNKGHPIEIKKLLPIYAEFVNTYLNHVNNIWLINLDKIPGSPGIDPSQKEINAAIKTSDDNYEILVREFGNRVLPVFHQGESSNRLDTVEAMSDYVCLSPRNDVGEIHRVRWARDTHARLPAGKKTHGLATTGNLMMTTVPWYSVDSATWVAICTYGSVIIKLNDTLFIIGVTPNSPARYRQELHMDNLNPHALKLLLTRLNAFSVTPDHLRHNLGARLAFTLHEVQDWVDTDYTCNYVPARTLWDL